MSYRPPQPLTYEVTHLTALEAALSVQIISLEARREACSGYVLNAGLQIEVRILTHQIDALKLEFNRVSARLQE